MESSSLIEIDGSAFEGGGQILRNSMALSNILQKPFFIKYIRKSRPKPGLNNQLISAIVLMKEISQAVVEGDKLYSESIYFYPKKIISGAYTAECHTAASITLMMQSLIPTLTFGNKLSSIKLKGGTVVSKSPPSSSISNILSVLLKKMGVLFEYDIQKEGYYPKGGGIANLKVQPIKSCLKSIEMVEISKIIKVNVEILHYVEKLNAKEVRKDFKKNIKKLVNLFNSKILKKSKEEAPKDKEEQKSKDLSSNEEDETEGLDIDIDIRELNYGKKEKKLSTYCVVFQALGKNNKCFFDCSNFPETNISVEKCIEEVLQKFQTYIEDDTCLDEYHQDQLLIYMALAEGISRIKIGKNITAHVNAALYVISKFIPESKVKFIDSKECIILEIDGVGFKNQF